MGLLNLNGRTLFFSFILAVLCFGCSSIKVSDYKDLDAALKTLKRQASESPVVRQKIENLARHADRHVATKAKEFLKQNRKD